MIEKPMKKMVMLIALFSFAFYYYLFNLRGSFALLHQRGVGGCKKIANVTFLIFIPCPQEFMISDAIFEKLDHCDLLTRAAVELAIERANQNRDILNNQSLLKMTSLYDDLMSVATINLPIELQIERVTDIFRFVNSSELFGVIGPNHPAAADFWAPIFLSSNLLTVSYDTTNLGVNKVSTFYRTLPSDRGANLGRLALMERFQWFRIATISSNEKYYAQIREDFVSLFTSVVRSYHEEIELALSTSFSQGSSEGIDAALTDIRYKDINIIFGFFGPEIAWKVLCTASSKYLVSDSHVWILPAYYKRNWWRANSLSNGGCSDTVMKEILESIIFINTVKIPPLDLSLDDFNRMLVDKMHNLFEVSSLTEEDLKPYLLHSRATNAYDAVTLLARSVGVAFDRGGKLSCSDTNTIQVALEKGLMECEYCRIYSGCFINGTEQCHEDLCQGPDFVFNHSNTPLEKYPEWRKSAKGVKSDHLQNFFGQVLYSQFIDGEDCPVGISWCFDISDPLTEGQQCFYALEELDKAPCDVRLKLSKFNFTSGNSNCPLNFQWRGSAQPPSSHFISKFGIPLEEIIVVGSLIGVGMTIAVVFLVFNIIWRQNKYVKASSPWINVILILGIIIRMPVSLLDVLTVSTAKYGFNVKHITPLCYFTFANDHLGEVIFISALLMKNWRIYRIFHNHQLKDIGKRLADKWLAVGIAIASLPTATVLIVMGAAFNVQLKMKPTQNENLHIYIISYCSIDHYKAFRITVSIYSDLLLFSLLILTFITTFIRSKTFHREVVLSLRAIAITILPLPIFNAAFQLILIRGEFTMIDHIQPLLWSRITLTLMFPVLIMMVLFIPNMYLIMKEYIKSNHPRSKRMSEREQHSIQLSSQYHQLQRQSETLKMQLYKYNRQITQLSLKLKQQEEASISADNHASKTSSTDGVMEESALNTQHTKENLIRFTDTQLHKHQIQDLGDAPSSSSMKTEGSTATLMTIVSDNLLAVSESSSSLRVADKELTLVHEDATSYAAVVSSEEGHLGGGQCKIFTLPDNNSENDLLQS